MSGVNDWSNYGETSDHPGQNDGQSVGRGMMASNYYLDSGDNWNSNGNVGAPSYHSFSSAPPIPPNNPQAVPVPSSSQTYFHDSLSYDNMPSLPPMSSFRPGGPTVSPTVTYGHAHGHGLPHAPPTPANSSPVTHHDPAGKSLVALYQGNVNVTTGEHTPSSYSGSACSTPVSSPGPNWTRMVATSSTSASFGSNNNTNATDHVNVTTSHLHTLVIIQALHLFRLFSFQLQTHFNYKPI
jgi:hypothetical protein